MKLATASFLGLSRATLLACVVCTPLLACKSSSGGSSSDGGTTLYNCSSNVGSTSGSAATITSGQSYQSMICYEGTSNWYHITVPAGETLLDISAGYAPGVVTQVDLQLKVFFMTNSTTLTQVQSLLAPANGDAGVGTINTTVLVEQPGDYYIQAADAHNTGFDATNAYTLVVTNAADPDSHEPNDTTAAAKASDSKPGYLAYLGDLDVFKTSIASASDLLTLTIANPKSAPAPVDYQITTSGMVVAEGSAPPQATPFNTVLPVTSTGTYYVTLSYPTGTIPDRRTADGYTLSFGTMPNPDPTDSHTISTAVCPGGGGTGPCSMAYAGSTVSLPPQKGFISVPGQRDFYRVDVASGAALVLQMVLASTTTTIKYALDLLTPDPNSACQSDSDCSAINLPCTKNTDCELSHACLPAAQSKFCPTAGVACTLCEGASICIPSGSSGGVCGISQYLSAYTPGAKPSGAANVSSAQPLFSTGSYYVVVHDVTYTNYDETNPYTLTLTMAPEPDPNDQSTTAANRNNFYDPYPTSMTDRTPDKARAIPISAAQLTAGVTGYISYQSDEDWFSFASPCGGADAGGSYCGIDFEGTQPVSNVKFAFFVDDSSTLLPQESFAYSGTVPPASAMTASLDNSSCSTCSFGVPGKTYYLQITDLHEKAWDYSNGAKYSFKVSNVTTGCPGVCNGGDGGTCVSQCAAAGTCCPTLQ